MGLFWQIGHDDGMELNINSRQTHDIVRGGPGYRPSFNSYMWADAVAISRIAELANDPITAEKFRSKADDLRRNLQTKLWDEQRQFFFPMSKNDEELDGNIVKALSLTYQTGKFAGSPHGRELIGYVPWQFNLPEQHQGYETAWKFLMDSDYFFAPFGPTTVERHDPLFVLQKSCCWWSGQSWPYATTQTLKAMANLLQNYEQQVVTKTDYNRLLGIYTRSHRKDGKPYLAEALHPDTGSFAGHDTYNHSEHYFHSGYCDLIITGLVGLKPRDDDVIEVDPLAPDDWKYFALDDVVYHGHRLSIIWDQDGTRYQRGPGLQVLVDGKVVAAAEKLQRLTAKLPPSSGQAASESNSTTPVNFAVNNDGTYFPQVTASHTGPDSASLKLIDGNYWYHAHPPNRWTTAGSENDRDWVTIDFGVPRKIHTIKLYFLDDSDLIDSQTIAPPKAYQIESWQGDAWVPLPQQTRRPELPTGRRANTVCFPAMETSKLRLLLDHAQGHDSGLTEIEAWGDAMLPVEPAPAPAGNLAYNSGDQEFPKAIASYTSRFDRIASVNDGRIVYGPTPANRWTSYESPSETDWLEIDFGKIEEVGRVELHIYDDRGGVQAPASYRVQYFDGNTWKEVANPQRSPAKPQGNAMNTFRFEPVKTTRLRVVFNHQGNSRSGLTEIEIWKQ